MYTQFNYDCKYHGLQNFKNVAMENKEPLIFDVDAISSLYFDYLHHFLV